MFDGKYTFEKSKIIYGDCLDKMNLIPDNSIDLICADLPYGVTANDLDKIISDVYKILTYPIVFIARELKIKKFLAMVLLSFLFVGIGSFLFYLFSST